MRKTNSNSAGATCASHSFAARLLCLAVLLSVYPAAGCSSAPLLSNSASLAPLLDDYRVTNKDRRDRFPTAAEAGL
ncbi:MAG: hypothetical protein WDZ59_10885 [Pirellulales bacterium]